MVNHIRKFVMGKFLKLILKGGYKFAIFAIVLEIFEHTALPAILAYAGRPELCWIGCTPVDEFIIYPLVIKFIFRQ